MKISPQKTSSPPNGWGEFNRTTEWIAFAEISREHREDLFTEPPNEYKEILNFLSEADILPIVVLYYLAEYIEGSIEKPILILENQVQIIDLVKSIAHKIVIPEDKTDFVSMLTRKPFYAPNAYPIMLGEYLKLLPNDVIEDLRSADFMDIFIQITPIAEDHILKPISEAFKEKFRRRAVNQAKRGYITIFRSAWKYIKTKDEETAFLVNRIIVSSQDLPFAAYHIDKLNIEALETIAPLLKRREAYVYLLNRIREIQSNPKKFKHVELVRHIG